MGRTGAEWPKPGPKVRESEGLALVTVVLALVGFAAVATAGFILSGWESRTTERPEASAKAYQVANAGLYDYLNARPPAPDTQVYVYPDGRAKVWATKLLDVRDGQPEYRLTSVGTHDAGKLIATRTVSTAALLASGHVAVSAAFTALAGLTDEAGPGTASVSGHDEATPGGCPPSGPGDVAGLVVPSGRGLEPSGRAPLEPAGSPAVDGTRSLPELARDVDWPGILSGSAVMPDLRVPPDAWPDFAALPGHAYPVVHASGSPVSLVSQHSGRGTLVVPGDLDLHGDFAWEGLLLVGGRLRTHGSPRVSGATFTGLNQILGEAAARSVLGQGRPSFTFHSCHVRKATHAFGGLREKPGSRFETM